jgi:3-oxoacyl-[acyl-carrier-protein] synthase III
MGLSTRSAGRSRADAGLAGRLPAPLRGAGIAGVGLYVPERVLTNFDLEKMVETSDDWIFTRTGISERRIVAAEEATSDLAAAAARAALAQAGVAASDVDLVIVGTITPDMPFPAVASIVQDRIGATRAGAFDLSAGCSGFVYGLATGAQFIQGGVYENVLVIGADVVSRILNWEDRSTCVLFGDGAGAALMRPAAPGKGLLAFDLGSDGSGAELLCVEAGGTRLPTSPETVAKMQHKVKMAGSEVFKFAVRVIEESTRRALERAGLSVADIDCFIAHQANARIIEAAARRLELPPERVFMNVDRYGNTSAASIPIALVEALAAGKVRSGDTVAFVGFGAGLSWAAAIVNWI